MLNMSDSNAPTPPTQNLVKVGDIVSLNSGGPAMTVIRLCSDAPTAEVRWWAPGGFSDTVVPVAALRPAQDGGLAGPNVEDLHGWAKVCAAVGLSETCTPVDVVEAIVRLRHVIGEANVRLAAACPEVDPSRCALEDTLGLLFSDVIDPAAAAQADAEKLRQRIKAAIQASDNDGGSASDAIQDMLAFLVETETHDGGNAIATERDGCEAERREQAAAGEEMQAVHPLPAGWLWFHDDEGWNAHETRGTRVVWVDADDECVISSGDGGHTRRAPAAVVLAVVKAHAEGESSTLKQLVAAREVAGREREEAVFRAIAASNELAQARSELGAMRERSDRNVSLLARRTGELEEARALGQSYAREAETWRGRLLEAERREQAAVSGAKAERDAAVAELTATRKSRDAARALLTKVQRSESEPRTPDAPGWWNFAGRWCRVVRVNGGLFVDAGQAGGPLVPVECLSLWGGPAPYRAAALTRGCDPEWTRTNEETASGKMLFRCSGCGALDAAPTKNHTCVKRRRLKLDPGLADGQHYTVGEPGAALLELISAWMSEAEPGEEITIGLVEMTDLEVEGLADV